MAQKIRVKTSLDIWPSRDDVSVARFTTSAHNVCLAPHETAFTNHPSSLSARKDSLMPHAVTLTAILFCSMLVATGCGAGDGAAVSGEPKLASSSELIAIVDLASLPHLPDSTFGQLLPTHVTAEAPGSVKNVTDHYLKALAAKGFAPGREANAKMVTDAYAQASLVGKDDVRVSLTVSPMGQDKVQVQLVNHGAFDVRHLGKLAGAETMFVSPTLASYATTASVADAATEVAAIVKKAGWQEFTQLNSQRVDLPNLQQHFYRQRGNKLDVSVTEAPAQGGKSVISYQVLALNHELPAPVDAVEVAFDDAKGELKCSVPRALAAVAADMQKLCAAAGLKLTPGEEPTEKRFALRYEAPSGDVILVTLTPSDEGPTNVRMLTVPAAVVERLHKAEEEAPAENPA
jgi:hypothetical protein